MQDTSHTFEIVHVISALALCELYGPFFIQFSKYLLFILIDHSADPGLSSGTSQIHMQWNERADKNGFQENDTLKMNLDQDLKLFKLAFKTILYSVIVEHIFPQFIDFALVETYLFFKFQCSCMRYNHKLLWTYQT